MSEAGFEDRNAQRHLQDQEDRVAAADFIGDLGRRVRRCRARRGLTRRQLAQESGTSERYLARIESGTGNPSVVVLRSIAQALEVPLLELVPAVGGRVAGLDRIVELLGRVPAADLPAVAEVIEGHLTVADGTDRGHRIALVGLRGAGKSTLGRMVADRLGYPFVELDRVVEQEYGAPLPLLIEVSGLGAFRRYERECLERVIAENQGLVLATAGGIVSNPETYALLLRRTHTVWVRARPEEHMQRVMAQGDFRPMSESRAAMADLVAILDARRADYARARAVLDTSGRTIQQSLAGLLELVKPWSEASH